VQTFLQWKQARAHVPLIKALSQHAEQLQQQEVDHALKLLARGDQPEAVLRALAHGLSQKMLHGAYASLTSPDPDIRQEAAAQVCRLFNLPDSL
jgi:glutamyl-tRNA reductase